VPDPDCFAHLAATRDGSPDATVPSSQHGKGSANLDGWAWPTWHESVMDHGQGHIHIIIIK